MSKYFELLRLNHWFKNLFIFAGSCAAYLFAVDPISTLFLNSVLAFLLASTVSSANYIINQIADRHTDAIHPEKKYRPIPAGHVKVSHAYLIAALLLIFSMLLAFNVFNSLFVWSLLTLGVAGLLYNVKPIRLKDIPYIDVLSESFNNPLRFLIGWFAFDLPVFPSITVLFLSWAFGAVFMTAKRYDELVFYGKDLGPYRRTFNLYTPTKLLWMIWLYAGISTLLALDINWLLGILLGIFFVWFINRVVSGKARARDIEGFIFNPFGNRK